MLLQTWMRKAWALNLLRKEQLLACAAPGQPTPRTHAHPPSMASADWASANAPAQSCKRNLHALLSEEGVWVGVGVGVGTGVGVGVCCVHACGARMCVRIGVGVCGVHMVCMRLVRGMCKRTCVVYTWCACALVFVCDIHADLRLEAQQDGAGLSANPPSIS